MVKRLVAKVSASEFKRIDTCADLVLPQAHVRLALFFRLTEPLAEPGECNVEHAVAESETTQRGQPFGPGGEQSRAVVQCVEILADHR